MLTTPHGGSHPSRRFRQTGLAYSQSVTPVPAIIARLQTQQRDAVATHRT